MRITRSGNTGLKREQSIALPFNTKANNTNSSLFYQRGLPFSLESSDNTKFPDSSLHAIPPIDMEPSFPFPVSTPYYSNPPSAQSKDPLALPSIPDMTRFIPDEPRQMAIPVQPLTVVSASHLQSVSAPQMQSVPTSQFQSVPTSQLQSVPASQLPSLSTSQLQSLSTSQLQSLSTSQLQPMSPAHLQSVPGLKTAPSISLPMAPIAPPAPFSTSPPPFLATSPPPFLSSSTGYYPSSPGSGVGSVVYEPQTGLSSESVSSVDMLSDSQGVCVCEVCERSPGAATPST